jgi:hypothetical protein
MEPNVMFTSGWSAVGFSLLKRTLPRQKSMGEWTAKDGG